MIHCHEYDCYESTVKVIRDALEKPLEKHVSVRIYRSIPPRLKDSE